MNKKHIKPLALAFTILMIFTAGLVVKERYKQSDAAKTPKFIQFMESVRLFWHDTKLKLRPPVQAGSDVLVAKIDDASLERWGRWPWNRQIYSEILDYLYELGAEVIAFDAVFSEPEFQPRFVKESFTEKVENLPDSLQGMLKLNAEGVQTIVEKLPDIGDQVFASAVKRHPKTVLGYAWQGREPCLLYDPANPDHKKDFGENLSVKQAQELGLLHVEELSTRAGYLSNHGISVEGVDPFTAKKATTNAFVGSCPLVNRPQRSANAQRQGYFNADADPDGIFRRMLLVQGFDADFVPAGNRDFLPEAWYKSATFFPSLSVEAVAAYYDSPSIKLETYKSGDGLLNVRAVVINRKEGSPLRLETLPDGTLSTNFYGSQKKPRNAGSDWFPPIPEFSLGSIKGDLDNVAFKNHYGLDPVKPLTGKIVLIAPVALGVFDLRPSPVQGDMPGGYHHATLMSRIMEYARNPKTHITIRTASLPVVLTMLWLMGVALAFFLALSPALVGAIGAGSFAALFLGIDYFMFWKFAYATQGMIIAVALGALFLSIFAYKYFTEERERKFVKGAFEKYVSPDVVGDIMKDPKKLNLGGQKKKLSVMFSDIRGFTTISEKLDAAALAKFLNDYLSPMTDIVLENKGTVDKYMGDAIMAIFGAPVEYPNHAQKAVDAGLKMLSRLAELRVEWAAKGLPSIEIGVGINTGDMSVGNMGSTRIFSYTVMGDSVNLGSRLEGINKEYHTHLIVSEFTKKELPPDYITRELDRVKVKGKHLPVTIHEVMGVGDDKDKRELAARFETALSLYYKKHFNEAKVMFMALAAKDETSKIYVQRCELWTETPPEEDWDGSWTMKTK